MQYIDDGRQSVVSILPGSRMTDRSNNSKLVIITTSQDRNGNVSIYKITSNKRNYNTAKNV